MARFVGICIFTSVCMVAFLGSNHARDPGRRPPSAIPGPVNERYVFSSVGLHGSCIKLYPLSPPYWAHGGVGGGCCCCCPAVICAGLFRVTGTQQPDRKFTRVFRV